MVAGLLTAPSLVAGGAADRGGSADVGARRVQFGAFVDGVGADPGEVDDFEKRVDRPLDIASYFLAFGDVFPFPV